MIDASRQMGARVLMNFDSPKHNNLVDLYLHNGLRICGTNDRWFPDPKNPTAVFAWMYPPW